MHTESYLFQNNHSYSIFNLKPKYLKEIGGLFFLFSIFEHMYAHFWKCGISGHYTQFYLGPCWRLVVALNQSNWTCPDGPWKMIFATHSWVHTSEIVWPTFLFVSRFLRFFFSKSTIGMTSIVDTVIESIDSYFSDSSPEDLVQSGKHLKNPMYR